MRALAIAAVCVVACRGGSKSPPPTPTSSSGSALPVAAAKPRATIRWTSYGIPHIEAQNLEGLAFGQGYATAVHNVCVLADQIVKVRSERAKFFGAAHVESDFGWLALGVMETAKTELPKASPDARALAAGFAAGYNAWLAEKHALPADCAGAEWVRPITDVDLVAYWLSIGMIGSSGYFVDAIARAQPPAAKGASLAPSHGDTRGPWLAPVTGASNGWGIGGDRTTNGRGMLVANPHFPWEGELRFAEAHLTIPGDIDVYGAQLIGLPLVGIGFTAHHAWTHTFSSSSRFVLYRLPLEASEPTTYKYGDATRAMEKREHAIDVRADDGSITKLTRTLYRSHYGPILVTNQLGWSTQFAFAIRDVTRSRTMFDQYLAMFRAKTLDAFKAAFATHQTTPFLNTIYADAEGNAWYIDGSAVPDLPAAGLAAWQMGLRTIPELAAAWQAGVIVLDGSMPIFELATDNAARPGAIPTERAPQLATRDYVMNANDAYWLTNPTQLLTGFSPFYGDAEKPPSARTRMNHVLIGEVAKFDGETLKKQILSNRALTSELLRADVVTACKKDKSLARACATLEAWDGTFGVDAKGAALWRELLPGLGAPWAEPFDATKPVGTPRGLAPATAKTVPAAIKAAQVKLARAKIDPAARLGDVQFTERAGKRFGVPGSNWAEGSTNPSLWQPRSSTLLPAMTSAPPIDVKTGLTAHGYPVNYGSSFVLAVTYEDGGPRADAILTYSQSSDSKSPHAADQTARYAQPDGGWRPVLFTRAQIDADPALRVQDVAAP